MITPVEIYKQQKRRYWRRTLLTIRTRLPRIEAFELRGPSFGGTIFFACAEARTRFSIFLHGLRGRCFKIHHGIVVVGCDPKERSVCGWPFRDRLRRCEAKYIGSVVPHTVTHGGRRNNSEYATVLRIFEAKPEWRLVRQESVLLHLGHIHDFKSRSMGRFPPVRILGREIDPRMYRNYD